MTDSCLNLLEEAFGKAGQDIMIYYSGNKYLSHIIVWLSTMIGLFGLVFCSLKCLSNKYSSGHFQYFVMNNVEGWGLIVQNIGYTFHLLINPLYVITHYKRPHSIFQNILKCPWRFPTKTLMLMPLKVLSHVKKGRKSLGG